jgi:hypothetical protein
VADVRFPFRLEVVAGLRSARRAGAEAGPGPARARVARRPHRAVDSAGAQADAHAGADTIVFDEGPTGTIALTGGQLDVTDDVTITAAAPAG